MAVQDFSYPEIPPEASEDIFYRSDMMRSLEKMVDDDFVKEKLKDFELWSILSKSYKLTFFSMDDVYVQENLFEAEVCKLLRSIPPCMHDTKLSLKIGQSRMIFQANLRRSLGTNDRNKINERIAQISQFRQFISSSMQSQGGGGIRGFLSKLAGGRRG